MRSTRFTLLFIVCLFVPIFSSGLAAPIAASASSLPSPPAANQAASKESEAFFEQKIRPLLVDKCFSCHSLDAKKQKGGLLLDSRDALLHGGDSGPAAAPGKPAESLLLRAVLYHEPDLQMPPKEKLAERDVALLSRWIELGLPFPSRSTGPANSKTIDWATARQFWSFQPLATSEPPAADLAPWSHNRIDAFLLQSLRKKDLQPAPEAPRTVLLRRAKFDLLGLPPTPEEIDSFEKDASPDAYSKRIDAWLNSPQFGERWARLWLDLVRYCDIGESWMESKGQAYPYRDWVVQALNRDLPYDRFVTLQLAADQLPDTQPGDRAALGLLGLSPSYWKELQLPVEIIKTIVSDEYEERIHTLSSTFLGVNLACARCHDHKFDPFTAEDYYGLAGILASTRPAEQALQAGVDAVRISQLRKKVASLEDELKKLKPKKTDDASRRIGEIECEVAELKADPQFDALLVHGVRDGSLRVEPEIKKHGSRLVYTDQPQNLALEVRGNPNRTGPVIERRFPMLFTPQGSLRFNSGSGRLEFAKALFEHAQPLVARIIVNRIWLGHFGTGIVATPSDFGFQGEKPSHPELLDDLARRFIQQGWSMKWLHREIMLSAAYRQASGTPSDKDPDLRLLSRFPRRRLDIEQWRDALLEVSAQLDLHQGGPALDLNATSNHRRTLYGLIKRRELADILRLHDFPDPLTHSAARYTTTTPLQQLFTLNSPFIQQGAQALAQRLNREANDDPSRIQRAYQLLFSRSPAPHETSLALAFLGEEGESAWPQYLQVLLGSNEFTFVD